MKKLLALFTFCAILFTSQSFAQQGNGNGNGAGAQRMREQVKPALIEKTKLTDEQAEKVLNINMDVRKQMREMRNDNLSPDERRKKIADLDVDRDKKYKAIPLTDDQVKAVNEFFAEMRKQQMQNRPNAGGGN